MSINFDKLVQHTNRSFLINLSANKTYKIDVITNKKNSLFAFLDMTITPIKIVNFAMGILLGNYIDTDLSDLWVMRTNRFVGSLIEKG